MKKKNAKTEEGMIVVEAMIILPLVVLSVFLLLFVSLLLFERAMLQSSLETAVVYFTTGFSDDFVNVNSEITYDDSVEEDGKNLNMGSGNHYDQSGGALFAYRNLFGNKKKVTNEEFRKYFMSIGTFLYTEKIEISVEYKNFFIYEELKASAVQRIRLPIDFSLIGGKSEYVLEATASAVSVDHEEIVDNMDFIAHIVNKTKLGDMIKEFGRKVSEVYNKIRSVLGAK